MTIINSKEIDKDIIYYTYINEDTHFDIILVNASKNYVLQRKVLKEIKL